MATAAIPETPASAPATSPARQTLSGIPGNPDYEPVQEMRLAIVMYGGISLAIYMNGAAQELLNLVRATAPELDPSGTETGRLLWPDDRLPGGGRTYRRLGRMLTGGTPVPLGDAVGSPVRTRFVIDIVTGTSAGGLNGVFLAKALCNQESMDQLTDLWRKEGDIPRLLDDGGFTPISVNDYHEPDALLNGRKIYDLLYDAIRGMQFDGVGAAPNLDACSSPYVDELDLFVTATDVNGLLMPIKLQDEVIFERRYRNFYHFRYGYPGASGAPYNSFRNDNRPFLAFASRCTSAFPFAFPPMSMGRAADFAHVTPSDGWRSFYQDYVRASKTTTTHNRPRDDGLKFTDRYFIDGGCLDNKPFGYAVDALLWKQSRMPVTRKLFYLEPDPLDAASQLVQFGAPDAFGTVNAGYVDLPRVEGIREDLMRVLDRNKTINRIRDVVGSVRPPVKQMDTKQKTDQWRSQRLSTLFEPDNPAAQAYVGYHRIKISAVTDFITNIVVCAAGLDVDSDDAMAVRYLVKAWRDATYPDIEGLPAEGGHTSADFLLHFDFDYRIRRFSLLRRYVDLYHAHYAQQALTGAGEIAQSVFYLHELHRLREGINAVRRGLLRTQEWLVTSEPAEQNPLMEALVAFNQTVGFERAVHEILDGKSDKERLDIATAIFREPANRAAFEQIAARLDGVLAGTIKGDAESPDERSVHRVGFIEAADRAEALIHSTQVPAPSAGNVREARPWEAIRPLGDYYFGYENYDAATFPLLWSTQIGEPSPIEVVRMSPVDTKCLPLPQGGKPKLAGVSLGHFGAFLDQCWRENDILWGRLDAVERIIRGLAPEVDEDEVKALVAEGQRDVLKEWCDMVGRTGEGDDLYDAISQQKEYVAKAKMAGTSTDWKLTPEIFAAAARAGAQAALPRPSRDTAMTLGKRTLGTVSGVLRGVSANNANAGLIREISRALATVLGVCRALLARPALVTLAAGLVAGLILLAILAVPGRWWAIGAGLFLLASIAIPIGVYRRLKRAIVGS